MNKKAEEIQTYLPILSRLKISRKPPSGRARLSRPISRKRRSSPLQKNQMGFEDCRKDAFTHRISVQGGEIALHWNSMGLLTSIDFESILFPSLPEGLSTGLPLELPSRILEITNSLLAYFSEGQPMTEVPWSVLCQDSLSDFQRSVLRACAAIPHGETRNYGWISSRVGNAAASRAVGQALRNNPFPILVPCHRVTSVDALGGFMGFSHPDDPALQFKKRLIMLESEYRNPTFPFLLKNPLCS